MAQILEKARLLEEVKSKERKVRSSLKIEIEEPTPEKIEETSQAEIAN